MESTFDLIVLLVPFFIFIYLFMINRLYPTTPAVVVSDEKDVLLLPPSPRKLPIIGNLHQLGSFPHRSLWNLAQRHGPVMLLHFGSVPVVVISSAHAAREVLKTNDIIFSNRPRPSSWARLLYNCKDVAMAPYGEYWRQIRGICVLHLLSNRRVHSFRAVREEETALLMDNIISISSSSSSSTTPINLSHLFQTLTNDLICRVALGRKYSSSGGESSGSKNREVLTDFERLLGGFNLGDYIPWLSWLNFFNGFDAEVEKVATDLDRFLEQVLTEHEKCRMNRKRGSTSVDHNEGKDFMDILLDIQEDDNIAITRDGIKALTLDMFAAGSNTSYSGLEWAMTELLRHPQVMRKLQNEVREIIGLKGDQYDHEGKNNKQILLPITEDEVGKMQYLKAVIKEALRLHPPAPLLVPRVSTEDAKIMGYDITAGTQVLTNAWAIGRDPQLWYEVDEFRPERFLNSSIDFRGQDFELIPFGSGRRGCPGIQFAVVATELVLANLIYRFDLKPAGGGGEGSMDVAESPGLIVHRKHPLLAVAAPWTPP